MFYPVDNENLLLGDQAHSRPIRKIDIAPVPAFPSHPSPPIVLSMIMETLEKKQSRISDDVNYHIPECSIIID